MSVKPRILLLAICCVTLLSASSKPSHEQVQAWYEQGKDLRTQGEPAKAMAVFLRAAHSGTDDEMLLGRVYSNMANICRQANEHLLAYYVYSTSAEHFLASKDDLAYGYALNNMAWEQAAMAHKDSAWALIDQALQVYPLYPLVDKVVETRAAACYFTQEYDSVLYYSTPPADDYLLMLRAQAYSFMHVDDSATYYAQMLLPRTDNPFYLDDLYYILTHNDLDIDAETLRELSSERADVLKTIEERHGKLMQAVQLLADDIDKKPTSDWKLLVELIILGFLCIVSIFIGIVTINERRRLQDDWEKHEQVRQEDYALNIRLLRESDDLRRELQWNDYDDFCYQTDKLFRGLATTLEQQGLNEQDIRICVLALIGLPLKQIAEMLPCSQKSIGKLKDVTARKLGVSGGQLNKKLEKIVCEW